MSDTSTKAPPEPTTVVADTDGQTTPIEITLNQTPADTDTSTADGGSRTPRDPVRAWPLALFGTEAATTGTSALYAAAGGTGVLVAAGAVAGGGLVAAGVVAARRVRKHAQTKGGGHRSALGSTGGYGRRGGLRSGGGRGSGLGGGSRGRGGFGAASGGASSPRPGARRGGAGLTKNPRPNAGAGSTRSGLRSTGHGGSGRSGGLGSRQNGPTGGKGGILRRLGPRQGHGAGGQSGTGGASGLTTSNGKGRNTLAAAVRRAARTGVRAAAGTARLGRAAAGSSAATAAGAKARAARRGMAKAANHARKRARAAWTASARKGRAALRYLLRSAAAKVAAGAVGALALIPGLLGRGLAATCGGILRILRLAPRNGTKWGVRCTRWSIHMAKTVHDRLMARARNGWVKDTRPDVLTDFDEPGHTLAPAGFFGTDHFGGNLLSVFQTETEAVRDAYAAYDPPMMLAVAAEYWGLAEGVSSVAEAVRQLAVNTADKYPADQQMADLVAQIYGLLHQATQAAQEVGPLFAKVHEHDLRRFEEPRNGEHMWNILERRPDGGYDQRQPSKFVQATQDVAHVYARYEPGHMNQVAAEYGGVPAGIENVAAAINLLQVRSNEVYPVDKAIVEAIADVHHLLMAAASAAQELMPNFRRLHAQDIARHEDPRNGEQGEAMWDV
ncbi:hypothetical protein ACFYUM_36520 [Streptomyces fimicarius]|uniref:hypothetical protein n=1 Tax=Streptomyces griseus TaxID=1911 RepID=UPI003675B780